MKLLAKGTARFLLLPLVVLIMSAPVAHACSVCYGNPESPLSKGMVWGVFTLLVIVGGVLAGIGGFFIFLAKRSGSVSQANLPETTGSVSNQNT
jgi:hypothetical protein